MVKARKSLVVFLLLFSFLGIAGEEEDVLTQPKMIEYGNYDHSIQVEKIRSGNHDKDGTNEYLFSLEMKIYKAPPPILDPRKRKKKQKIKIFKIIELGDIEPIEIDVLTWWRPTDTEKSKFNYKFSGDFLRKQVAEFMNEHSLKEADVKAKIKIKLSSY